MTKINLLPWREKKRTKEVQQIIIICALIVGLALFLNGIFYLFEKSNVSHQAARNQLLQTEINNMQSLIKQKNKHEEKKAIVTAQMQTLVNLNNQRIQVYELLQTLPTILPENVYLLSIAIDQFTVTLEGEAPANTQASALIDNIDKQPSWHDAHLLEVALNKKTPGKTYFRINFKMEK